MGDDGIGVPLSRRVPGSTRSGPGQHVRRDLSDTDVGRIQAAIDAEHASEEMPSQREPNTEPIPAVAVSGPAANPAGNPPATSGTGAKAPRATKAPRGEEPLRAAAALLASAELRAAEKPRSAQPPRADEPRSAAGRLRPEEPVLTEVPARAPEPVIVPEPMRAPEPVRAPEPPSARQPAPPERVPAPEAVIAAQPVISAEPARRVEPPRGSWTPAEPAPGTIGWLWPEEAGAGGAGRGYRPPGRRIPSGGWRYRKATLIAAGAVVLAAGGLVLGTSLRGTPGTPAAAGHSKPPAGAHSGKSSPTTSGPGPATSPPPLHASEVIRASRWVARQVSADAKVACTPQICPALISAGLPASQEVQLGTNSQSLSNAKIIVVTPVLRYLFSTTHGPLGRDVAPVVLAKFGSGSAPITIQPVYPYGGAAYQAAFRQGVENRIDAGEQLLTGGHVSATAAARSELAAGQVDPRLLLVLRALTSQQPVDIVSFADAGPGASAGIPFRVAYLAARDPASALSGSAYTQWMGSVLLPASTAFPHPHARLATLPDGEQVAMIEYGLPSPLGLGSGG